MALDKDAPIQLHYQLANELRQRITQGQWMVGELFPTDRKIIERYGVSATTARRAIKQLVSEGWLIRQPGRGTFIQKEPFRENLGALTGFFEEMRNRGLAPSAEILYAGPYLVDEAALKKFPQLNEFNTIEVVLIEKIHRCDGRPISYVHCFWRKEFGERLLAFDLSCEGSYGISRAHFNLTLTNADETIQAGPATEKEAACLEIKKNAPVLIMERLTSAGDKLAEFSYNVYRADRYKYHIKLHANEPMSEPLYE